MKNAKEIETTSMKSYITEEGKRKRRLIRNKSFEKIEKGADTCSLYTPKYAKI